MGITFRIALRNLRLHWLRTSIVGLLLVLGTFTFVLGQSVLGTVQAGMRRSVIDSLAGDIQAYSASAKDELALYGSLAQGVPDIGQIDDFSKVKAALEAVPEVEAVVPMGLHRSVVFGNSMIDLKLAELRKAVNAGDKAAQPPLVAHVRMLLDSLETEVDKLARVATDATDAVGSQKADLARAKSDQFWADFDADPLAALEFLDNKIAPIGLASNMYFMQYVGADTQAFVKNFELFEVVEGQMIPPGERGFMFNTQNYERFLKHPAARAFDALRDAAAEGRAIATDSDLKRLVERLIGYSSQVTDQIDPARAPAVAEKLRAVLGLEETKITALVPAFLAVTDENLDARFKAFYEILAPEIRLYAYRVGDTLALQSQTKSGYISAVNVKVWGVFRFKGLEKSTLAGVTHLMDITSFREIYGLANPVSAEEVKALKEKSGIKQVSRDTAEADLFGGEDAVVGGAEVASKTFDDTAGTDIAGLRRAAVEAANKKYTQADIDNGPVLSAAIFLKDPEKAEEGLAAVQRALEPLGVKAVPWNQAVGQLVGGVVVGISVMFAAAVLILMIVAAFVIALGLALSTMQRLREIGTMRAIGANRSFVVRMVGVEAASMGLGFGVIGSLLAALVVAVAASGGGVPATSDIQYFIFGGAALVPTVSPGQIITALVIGLVVTLLASIIPAVIAARVKPISAMQAKE